MFISMRLYLYIDINLSFGGILMFFVNVIFLSLKFTFTSDRPGNFFNELFSNTNYIYKNKVRCNCFKLNC